MKDLYKLAGLDRFEVEPEIIKAAVRACENQRDRDLIAAILCDDGKKQAYDNALKTADLVEAMECQIAGKIKKESSGGGKPQSQSPAGPAELKAPIINRSGRRLLAGYGVLFSFLFIFAGWLSLESDDQHTDGADSDAQSLEITGEVEIIDITRQRYHVTAEALNVRNGPGTRYLVVGRLEKYDDLVAEFPEAGEGWVRIYTEEGVEGYVARDFVAPGDGRAAFRNYCMGSVTRPPTGPLAQAVSGGYQTLRVEAPAKQDVAVRLDNQAGDTVLLGYIRAGQVHSFDDIPAGHYQLSISAGDAFSLECGLFTGVMEKALFTRKLAFEPGVHGGPDASYQVTVQLRN